MEIQENSLPVFYLCRALGMAPYKLRRSSKGRIESIQLSYWWSIYSIGLLLTAVALTFRYILIDVGSCNPIRNQTATSRFVTLFDCSIVIFVCVCGVISGIIGSNNIRQMNKKLCDVDKELVLFNDQSRDRKRANVLLVVVFFIMSGMVCLDTYAKKRTVVKAKAAMDGKYEKPDVVYIAAEMPFYILYFMLMGVQAQFAHTAMSLARRYQRLNMSIESAFVLRKSTQIEKEWKMRSENSKPQVGINTVKLVTISGAIHEENKVHDASTQNVTVAQAEATATNIVFDRLGVMSTMARTTVFLDGISLTHAILGESVRIISNSYGITLVALLASCLLHTVATTYFLFFELLGDTDVFAASMGSMWLIFHICRIILIVEPCHMASAEAGKMIVNVCEVLKKCKDNNAYCEHMLHRFYRQLTADKSYVFTAFGMFQIERPILTSLSAAITTYLVILIQLQRNDDKKGNIN